MCPGCFGGYRQRVKFERFAFQHQDKGVCEDEIFWKLIASGGKSQRMRLRGVPYNCAVLKFDLRSREIDI